MFMLVFRKACSWDVERQGRRRKAELFIKEKSKKEGNRKETGGKRKMSLLGNFCHLFHFSSFPRLSQIPTCNKNPF